MGVDINQGDYDQRTPLHLAVLWDHKEIVSYLISMGADVNCTDRWGANPLDDVHDAEIEDMLIKAGAKKGVQRESNPPPPLSIGEDQYRLLWAAFRGDLLLMQRLNIIGWKVDAYDYDGRTALGVAASEGHLDAVIYLVTHGANIYHRDFRNQTPFDDAQREGKTEVAEYL